MTVIPPKAVTKAPPRAQTLRSFRPWTPKGAIVLLLVLLAAAGGYFAGTRVGFDQGAERRRATPNGATVCRPGPWGDLSFTPFTIAAPDDLLPIRSLESYGTHWFFKAYTTDKLVSLLQAINLPPDQQKALLGPDVLHVQNDGIMLTPTPDQVIALPAGARSGIYEVLAGVQENDDAVYFIPKDKLDERFNGSGVSLATLTLFKELCCDSGNYLVFSGLPALLTRLPTYPEKLHFVKALTRQETMLLRLHITPSSDITALAGYWGKGCWGTDVATVMQSLQTIPTGTWMNILMVLPPLPTQEIYDYPTAVDNPLDGPPVHRDCHWTSLNFFRDEADPNFGKGEYVMRELKESYAAAPADPRYGDVILFSTSDGRIVHSAVYIADDICFTKNGGTVLTPWMLEKISDLQDQYSFMSPGGQALKVSYLRNKRL
jgi:hypothetical protein